MNHVLRVFAVLSIFLFGASGVQATLFGVGEEFGQLFTVDTSTAELTNVGFTKDGANCRDLSGLACSPPAVPEPSALALLCVGLLGACVLRRRT